MQWHCIWGDKVCESLPPWTPPPPNIPHTHKQCQRASLSFSALLRRPLWRCLQLCQVVAKQMAHMLTVPERKLVPMSSTATSQIGRAGLVEELKRIPGAPDPVLLETLPMGVAFHHAGVPLASLPFIFPLPDVDPRSSFRCVFCLLVSLSSYCCHNTK